MKITIRVLAIVSAALMGLSLMLLLGLFPFQGGFAQLFLNCPEEIVNVLPIFPLVPFLNCLLSTVCVALLILCCGNKRGGIWLELVVLGCLIIVLPVINYVASMVYVRAVANPGGVFRISAENTVSQISNICLIPSGLGRALAYVTCGMSIAYKKTRRLL